MACITMDHIKSKRREVNQAYAEHGFHSTEYNKSFDELRNMNRAFMAGQFRSERGLPPTAKTPYCT